jgi:hypothetical protein
MDDVPFTDQEEHQGHDKECESEDEGDYLFSFTV